MANIYLLRHGKVNGEAALYGHTDVSVSVEVNNKIVEQLKKQSLDIDMIFSSPLKRCLELAHAYSDSTTVNVLADLKEMNFGRYDGIAFDDLYQDKVIWQQLELFWLNPVQHPLPEAELLTGFSYRILRAWQVVISSLKDHIVQKNILIVCHGGVIRMLLAHLLNVDFRNPNWYTQLTIANASLTSIEYHNGSFSVHSIAKPLIVDEKQQATDNAFTLSNILFNGRKEMTA